MNAIKLFLPTGAVELQAGSEGVKKIFVSGDTGEVVILHDDNIVKYGNVPYIAMQDYKKEKVDEEN